MRKALIRLLVAVLLQAGGCQPCLADIWIVDGHPDRGQCAGGESALISEEGTFPALRLDLSGRWTDFMLKGSTDNFASVVYEVVSSAANEAADDTNVWVYFLDDYRADTRAWVRATNALPIVEQLVDTANSEVTAVLVYPSHECVVDWQRWMSRTNNRLVWSYARMDGASFEMNESGTWVHWNPVVPVAWLKERTAP